MTQLPFLVISSKPIGKGVSATVHKGILQKVESPSNAQPVAVKVLPRTIRSQREVDIHQYLSSVSSKIAQVELVAHDPDRTLLVMQLFPGTVYDRVKSVCSQGGSLTTRETRRILRQTASALRGVHKAGLVHKDVKLENILYDPQKRKVGLTDFGYTCAFTPGAREFRHVCGSPHYCPPEMFFSLPCEGPEHDVWALGVCAFVLATGFFPFPSCLKRRQYATEIKRGLPREELKDCDPRLAHLIQEMLTISPQDRISIGAILKHPFLKSKRTPALPSTVLCSTPAVNSPKRKPKNKKDKKKPKKKKQNTHPPSASPLRQNNTPKRIMFD